MKKSRLAIRVTEKEHAQIVKLSKEDNKTISDFVVQKSLSVNKRDIQTKKTK